MNSFDEIDVPLGHPFLYPRVLRSIGKHTRKENIATEEEMIEHICRENFQELSQRVDRTGIQESCAVRNVLRARMLANLLINEQGELVERLLDVAIISLREALYSIAPLMEADAVRNEHMLEMCENLRKNKTILQLIRRITRPYSNKIAEKLIRETLLLKENERITDTHARRACLAAWLTYLRQSLGSCFATAPAILVQREQPEQFLKDLDEMMQTDRLKRTYGGVEYSVPMSKSWGNGDLKKPILIQKGITNDPKKIWLSPGLLKAFESVGIFKEEMSSKERSNALKMLLTDVRSLHPENETVFYTDAEEIIRQVLFRHYNIDENIFKSYLDRPKEMIYGGLLMHVPEESSKNKGVYKACSDFSEAFEIAKSAFKSLVDTPLLKAWEFTIASFAEISLDFCRWNLYASLGINHDQPGGIGDCLSQHTRVLLDEANRGVEEITEQYNNLLPELHFIEGRYRSASTEKEMQWLKMEYQSRKTEMYHIEQMRDAAIMRARNIAGLYNVIIDYYDKNFFSYFQEVYDPEIHDIASGPFDDSPAGFRLLYKHGRSNPSQWTSIHTLDEFIGSLVSFLTIIEQSLVVQEEIKGLEAELSTLTTQLVRHVQSDLFIESAFFRMAQAYNVPLIKDPIKNLDKIEKKPWVQTSGGSMSTLVRAYFKKEGPPTDFSRWVENETELFAFFIDTLRLLPKKARGTFEEDFKKAILMHSPTHAFLLQPGYRPFFDAWTEEMYSYSWIKNRFSEPSTFFWQFMRITDSIAKDLMQTVLAPLPQNTRKEIEDMLFRENFDIPIDDFRESIVNILKRHPSMRRGVLEQIQDRLDGAIYSRMPYTKRLDVPSLVNRVLENLFAYDQKNFSKIQNVSKAVFQRRFFKEDLSAIDVFELIKIIIALSFEKEFFIKNVEKEIVRELRQMGKMAPEPIIFADSNWIKDYFAFVLHPTKRKIELWSVGYLGIQGQPISYWKKWVDGSNKQPDWGIYLKTEEYVL